MFHLYLVSQSESATILDDPLVSLAVRPTEMTDEILRNIIRACLVMNDEELPEGFEQMSGGEAFEYMREDMCTYYSEDTIVVVEDTDGSVVKMLAKVGEALGRTMQCDSSCYAAAEAWGQVVIEHGVEHFDI